MQGFSNFLGLFQVIMANPVGWWKTKNSTNFVTGVVFLGGDEDGGLGVMPQNLLHFPGS